MQKIQVNPRLKSKLGIFIVIFYITIKYNYMNNHFCGYIIINQKLILHVFKNPIRNHFHRHILNNSNDRYRQLTHKYNPSKDIYFHEHILNILFDHI